MLSPGRCRDGDGSYLFQRTYARYAIDLCELSNSAILWMQWWLIFHRPVMRTMNTIRKSDCPECQVNLRCLQFAPYDFYPLCMQIISIAALEIWPIEGPSRHVLATAKFTSRMTYQVCSDMTVPVVIDNDEVFSNIRGFHWRCLSPMKP